MECYLLSVEEFDSASGSEDLLASAMKKLDECRLEKVRRTRPGKARDLAVGAGLALQLAVQEGMRQGNRCGPHLSGMPYAAKMSYMPGIWAQENSILTVSEALERLGDPVQIPYRYGAHGKPDFAGSDWHFNLSHSGRYVCCVLDREEVGIDLQQMRPLAGRNPAGRFFSRRERERLNACGDEAERERLFYRIWVRKESYAKLTGEGIAAALAQDVWELEQRVVWQERELPAGYDLAICQYRKDKAAEPKG